MHRILSPSLALERKIRVIAIADGITNKEDSAYFSNYIFGNTAFSQNLKAIAALGQKIGLVLLFPHGRSGRRRNFGRGERERGGGGG